MKTGRARLVETRRRSRRMQNKTEAKPAIISGRQNSFSLDLSSTKPLNLFIHVSKIEIEVLLDDVNIKNIKSIWNTLSNVIYI